MNVSIKSRAEAGFGAVEGLLILVIVAAVIGTGVYVLKQKSTADKSLSSDNTSQTTSPANNVVSPTASLDKLTQQESQSETGFDQAGDSQTQQTTSSVDNTDNNTGGSVDEATL